MLILIISFYLTSYYFFDRYIDFINYKFKGFHTYSVWLPMNNFNDFLIRLIFSYFTSPLKILNLQNLNYLNIPISISIILGYIYFYIEIIKLRKINIEVTFLVLFKIIFCAIYTLMIENWGTYQRLLFTPLVLSIFLTINYSIYKKNEK